MITHENAKKRPISFKELLLIVLPLLLLTYPLWSNVFEDRFDKHLRQLAGPDATDLGHRLTKGKDDPVWDDLKRQCVEASQAKKPFRARISYKYKYQEDSFLSDLDLIDHSYWVAYGIAGNHQGQIFIVYDSQQWGKHQTFQVSKLTLVSWGSGRRQGLAILTIPPINSPFPFD